MSVTASTIDWSQRSRNAIDYNGALAQSQVKMVEGGLAEILTLTIETAVATLQNFVRTSLCVADTVARGFGNRFWLNDIIAALLASSKKGQPLFGVEYEDYETYVGLCCGRTGTRKLRPHQFRHGGASLDMANGVSAAVVKTRGLWKSDSTLHRYSKVGRYFRLRAMLPPASVEQARRAQVFLSKNLASNIRRQAVQKFPSANSR